MNKNDARTKKKDDRVELRFGEGGYQPPPDPKLASPPLPGDRGRVERLCMRAKKLEIVSDGTPEGTIVIVDGQALGGLVSLALVVQRGYPRVSCQVTQTYVREDLPEFGENRGKEVKAAQSNVPDTVLVDIFERA